MGSASPTTLTGGCQCGALRYAVTGSPIRVSICHCRMCQKASGAPFAALADFTHDAFIWTRGTPSAFSSSNKAERDFCPACGTPMGYRLKGGPNIELMTGTFDQPVRVVPTEQFGTESRLDWVTRIGGMPGKSTVENYGAVRLDEIVSRQHPDHE